MTGNRNTPGGRVPASRAPEPAAPGEPVEPGDVAEPTEPAEPIGVGDIGDLIARLAAALDDGRMTLDQVVSALVDRAMQQTLNAHLPDDSADIEALHALLQSLTADDPVLSDLVRAARTKDTP